MEATLALKVEELRDANEKVEDLQNSLETLQHLGNYIFQLSNSRMWVILSGLSVRKNVIFRIF
jgi:hypothetical protein